MFPPLLAPTFPICEYAFKKPKEPSKNSKEVKQTIVKNGLDFLIDRLNLMS